MDGGFVRDGITRRRSATGRPRRVIKTGRRVRTTSSTSA